MSTKQASTMDKYLSIAPSVKLGKDVKLSQFINLYGCEIGDGTKIGAFVEIQKNANVGKNCKISSHTFVCEGVTIEDNVFIGHGVMFINDSYPRAANEDGSLQTEADCRTSCRARCRVGWRFRLFSYAFPERVAIHRGSDCVRSR